MNKRDAQRIVRRALRDGFYSAEIKRWSDHDNSWSWKVVILPKDALVGGLTVYDYEEYEQEKALSGVQP